MTDGLRFLKGFYSGSNPAGHSIRGLCLQIPIRNKDSNMDYNIYIYIYIYMHIYIIMYYMDMK